MAQPNPVPGFEAPRSPIDGPPQKPKTVGYLIGGLVQMGLGGLFLLRALLDGDPSTFSIVFGLFLIFLGARAALKYRRSRQEPLAARVT